MEKIQVADKSVVIEILVQAFDQNQSINFLLIQDKQRKKRIRKLMEYSIKVCAVHGKVLLSADKIACALVMLEPKKFSMQSLFWDLELIFSVLGVRNLFKVLKRERLIALQHRNFPFYSIWFIGVMPGYAGLGKGSVLLKRLIAEADALKLPMYLETSTIKNIPWYEKFGFKVFHHINLGYNLFFMKR